MSMTVEKVNYYGVLSIECCMFDYVIALTTEGVPSTYQNMPDGVPISKNGK